jgi:hypothetical protein
MTAIRQVHGNAAVFEISHFPWRSNLVLLDNATDSLWGQLMATARRPVRRHAAPPGERRPPPFRFAWVDFHPDTSIYGQGG